MSIFSKIKVPKVKKSSFNLSYMNKFSCDFGELVPFYLEKVVPGDVFKHSHRINTNLASLSSQLSQEFDVRSEYFFVPSRLLWENFNDFLVGGADGQQEYLHPNINLADFSGIDLSNTVLDYLGYKTYRSYSGVFGNDLPVDALPLLAYIKVWFDYYADENLNLNSFQWTPVSDGNIGDANVIASLLAYAGNRSQFDGTRPVTKNEFLPFFRNYRKDYLTSALPFAQKGQVVTIPVDGVGEVNFQTELVGTPTPQPAGGSLNAEVRNTPPTSPNAVLETRDSGGNTYSVVATASGIQATATLDDFRTAMRVQEWLEKNARSGTRPYEMLFSHFGVKSQDSRLQRAEYIQGNLQLYSVGNVYSTAQATNLSSNAGYRVSVVNGSGISKTWKFRVPEHGYILGICTPYPVASYMDGLRRQFLELDRFDYLWPEFANLGEQPIYMAEVVCADEFPSVGQERPKQPKDTFGYTPRYSQYKTHMNEIHGNYLNNLDTFHDARDLWNSGNNNPRLNDKFISMNPDYNNLNRIFNNVLLDPNSHHVYFDVLHNVKAVRPLPYFDTPRIL